jgi:hypothetical protein
MRMLELRDRARLAVEPPAEFGIRREDFRQDLDGHDAIETRIARAL